ncbi:unnamed protein product [Calicophoron daubneyi]|uniref:Uncharacterized protein n=1 Tax=Calicophoron daubneyi TaxID=300641 RepID=A0AAV2TR03_CALDB
MNVFERLQNHFSKLSATPPSMSGSRTLERSSTPPVAVNYSDPNPVSDRERRKIPADDCGFGDNWVTVGDAHSRGSLANIVSNSGTLSRANDDATDKCVSNSTTLLKQNMGNVPGTTQPQRARRPLGSFYNVSSDEDDDSEEDEEVGENASEGNEQSNEDESSKAFQRRSLRIRRSLDKAKAALPADFADRIGVAPEKADSVYREPTTSLSRPTKTTSVQQSEGAISEEADHQSNSEEENELTETQNQEREGMNKGNLVLPSLDPESDRRNSTIEQDDGERSTASSSKDSLVYFSRPGIQWSNAPARPLEEIMPELKNYPPGTTHLVKTVSQRTGCRCALCGHDSLMLFAVLDASLALGHWCKWALAPKSHTRFSVHDHCNSYHIPVTSTEVLAQVYVFRQCRGWYEVLNEDHQPIPHLTTVEQVRRARPSTFLIRRDLRCLAAPPELLVPRTPDHRGGPDGPPPLPSFPSSVVALATSPDILQASTPEILPAGTLMHFVTYLPHCPVKRGRKVKELGLILTTKRTPNSPMRRPKGSDLKVNDNPQPAYYLGLEDSTPAVFPPKFSLSPVAGPENISGVHSLASVLRKFRLPLSVRPIFPQETGLPGQSSDSSTSVRVQPNLLNCGLSAIPGLFFSDRHYFRLQSLFRGDLLIISPVSSPEHLFIITPTMLRDHVFHLGSSIDPAYLRLLENHRLQAANFLATAHPKDSLNYLVRHMRNVTREPRESYATRMCNRSRFSTVQDPSSTETEMTQEEIYRTYDELDEIYFYIRHGYYPSKTRRPETPVRNDSPHQNTSRKQSLSAYRKEPVTEQTDLEGVGKRDPNAPSSHPQVRAVMPTAEDLLAASLGTPLRQTTASSQPPKWPNGTANAHRSQPKEYDI